MAAALKEPKELVVYDGYEPCAYLDGRRARMPLRLPLEPLSRAELDESLAAGDRRSGAYLYRTQCPACSACQPIRVLVEEHLMTRTDRRVRRRGDRIITMEMGAAILDGRRVELFNLHRCGRGLGQRDGEIDAQGYSAFLVDTCCETFELRYYMEEELIAVAVCDRGKQALNAVYSFYDPRYDKLSPGVYSILRQIELCRQWKLRYLYLGFYIAECPAMSYKNRYLPHERLIDGRWRRFTKPDQNLSALPIPAAAPVDR